MALHQHGRSENLDPVAVVSARAEAEKVKPDFSLFDQFVKDVFEHFRNLMVCMVFLVSGYLLIHPELMKFDCTRNDVCSYLVSLGILNIVVFCMLFVLNLIRVIRMSMVLYIIGKIVYADRLANSGIRPRKRPNFYIFPAIVILVYLAVVLSFIYIGVKLQVAKS